MENGCQRGPLTIEQLKSFCITAQTKVWRQGMTDWACASEVPELSELLETVPPPFHAKSTVERPPMPKSWLVESILVTVLCCLPFGIAGIVYSTQVDSLYRAGKYEEAEYKSGEAKKWTLWGFGCGMAIVVLYVIMLIVLYLTDSLE